MEGLTQFIFLILYIKILLFSQNSAFGDDIYLCTLLPAYPILETIPKQSLYTITGNMLGDGSIRLNKNNGIIKPEGKYSMTMDTYSLNYLNHLFDNIYGQFSSNSIKGYPNLMLPQHKGKQITQYHFSTKSHPLFTALHGSPSGV